MSSYAEKFEELRRRADERESMRYPEQFRNDAVALVDQLRDEGWTQKAISEALEIPWGTLGRWREKTNEAPQTPDGFRPVEVVDAESGRQGVSVVSPAGWRIEGLSLGQALDALRRLQ